MAADKGKAAEFLRRHAGMIVALASLVVAVVALVPTFRATDLADDAKAGADSAQLSVAGIDMASTVQLREENKGFGEVIGTEQVDAPAAKIILRNSGEQTALVRRIAVHISRVWAPESCGGGGPGATSVIYDFVLPGDIERQRFPLDMSRAVDFEVAGRSTDRLAVTIGEVELGETGWSWITAATAELELDDGRTIETDPFVLMNSATIERAVGTAQAGAADISPDWRHCVQRNIALLEQALGTSGTHSPSIRQLHDRLRDLGYSSHGFDPPGAPTSTPGRWIAMLSSLPEATTTPAQARKAAADLTNRLGVAVESVSSSAYASLTPGYRVLYHDDGFADGHAALAFCRAHGVANDNGCVGRYLSGDRQDSGLVCHFADPPGSPHCVRP
jgi:hypothetical protein